MESGYQIEKLTLPDYPKALNVWNLEGWQESIQDAVPFFSSDPDGFFVGKLHGEVIFTVSAVRYGNYAHIGSYCSIKEHRGKGYGLKIFNHIMNHLKDVEIIGLDAAEAQAENYKKQSFVIHAKGQRFTKDAEGEMGKNLVDISTVELAKIVEYDTGRFGNSREVLIRELMKVKTNRGLVFLKNDQIQGYGFLREGEYGYKIAPFVAENKEAAEELISGLQSLIPGQMIVIDIFETCSDMLEIMKSQKWSSLFNTYRMYAKGVPNLDLTKPYATILGLG